MMNNIDTTARSAMKLALEVLKVSVPVILGDFSRHSKATAALREALASEALEQPSGGATLAQQEPVAWMYVNQDGECEDIGYGNTYLAGHEGCTPLYTSPPAQRTWVGLTDEDVRQCSRDVVAGGSENSVDRFAYAIEAKLKAKNSP